MSLSLWPSFLKICICVPKGELQPYAVFTFEPLHKLHLGNLKLMEEWPYDCLSSGSLQASCSAAPGEGKTFFSMSSSMLMVVTQK